MNIQPTSEAAAGYVWFAHHCLKLARQTGRPGAKAFRDGRLLVICKYTLDHATLITLSQGDFAMHPRSGTVAKLPYYDNEMNLYTLPGINGGGWRQTDGEFAELATRFGYPLVDDDRGTFLITIDNEEFEVEWAGKDSENYGNIWWQGLGDNPPVLSWRGPPSIQFSISGAYNIPGLSQVESTSRGKSYYTVFGCHIYRDGRDGTRFCHGPQWFSDNEMATLVVGACYSIDSAGATWLVAICITRKGAGSFVLQVWRSNDEGTTWNLLNEFDTTGRARVPAFIAADGMVFVYDGTLYRIDSAVSRVSRTGKRMPDNPEGTRTITGAGGYGSNYELHGTGYCWPGLSAAGELEYSSYTASARFISTGNGAANPTTKTVPVYRGSPATSVALSVSGSGGGGPCEPAGDGTNLVFTATVNGSYCQAIWSGVDCADGLAAVKQVEDCASIFSVSVTIQPQNITATYEHSTALPAIAVSGPEQVYAGAAYSAANTVGPVTWSITKGTISQSGVITDVTGCGCATITATDTCGRTGALVVRMPTGVWVSDNNQVTVASFGYPLNSQFPTGFQCNSCYGMNYVYAHTLTPNILEFCDAYSASAAESMRQNGHAAFRVIAGGKRYFSELEVQYKSRTAALSGFNPWAAIGSTSDAYTFLSENSTCAHDGLNSGCCNCQSTFDGNPFSFVLRSSNNYSETWSCP
jgi:hypothetical protein